MCSKHALDEFVSALVKQVSELNLIAFNLDEKPLLPIHQKELKKYKSADKGFMEETQGINVFSRLKEPEKVGNSLKLNVLCNIAQYEHVSIVSSRSKLK